MLSHAEEIRYWPQARKSTEVYEYRVSQMMTEEGTWEGLSKDIFGF